jgi:hypothetical protein
MKRVRLMIFVTLVCLAVALFAGCASAPAERPAGQAGPAEPQPASMAAEPAEVAEPAEPPAESAGSPEPVVAPAAPAEVAEATAPPPLPAKIRITRRDELPRHVYPFSGQATELMYSREQVLELARLVRADLESDLAAYEIADPTTLKEMYATLVTIDLLEGRYDDALRRTEQIRALEEKPAAKFMTGMFARAFIWAHRETGGGDSPALREAFYRHFAAQVADAPWEVVRDEIEQGKGRLEIMSPNLIAGFVQGQLQPAIDHTGELSADMAGRIIGVHSTLTLRLPLRNEMIAIYQNKIDANRRVKHDIWAAREVALAPRDAGHPVLMAVWDSGTDPDVFREILWTNPGEQLDGEDTDFNGFVDDVHGIAYDIHARKTTGLLCPLEDMAERLPDVMQHVKGFTDLQAAVDSPEAVALKRFLAGIRPAEVQGFLEDLALAGNYCHGTHVAGIMVAGNPFARLLIARLSYDHRLVTVPRTLEWGLRDADKFRNTVTYFVAQKVRIANMSWGESQGDIESSLEQNGIGASAEERREMAREVFSVQRQGLHDAIQGAPNVLFICAAGNADNDVVFDEYIPASFDLPNLLVVGAVDQAGDPTSFTSFGPTVAVYANGFEVESYVPGGARMKMSGTSMAAPNVANLAAKMMAIDPGLTPEHVILLIKKGAERRSAGSREYLLIHPQRTLELTRQRLKS